MPHSGDQLRTLSNDKTIDFSICHVLCRSLIKKEQHMRFTIRPRHQV